jgi:excisionase family DNA binding protein
MELSKLLYSKKESSILLSVSLRTVDKLVSGGVLRTKRLGKRVLVLAESLEQYAGATDRSTASPPKPPTNTLSALHNNLTKGAF